MRIRSPAGEGDKAAIAGGFEHRDVLPHPILRLGGREGVDVEHGLPSRLGPGEILEGGSSPDSLGMIRVPPEIVAPVADLPNGRNLLLGVEDGPNPPLEFVKSLAPGQRVRALRVACLDPSHRAVRPDVLQPEIRVTIAGGVIRRPGPGMFRHEDGQRDDNEPAMHRALLGRRRPP